MSLLSPRQQQDFFDDGFLKIPRFYDYESQIAPIQLKLGEMIHQVAIRHGLLAQRSSVSANEFDSEYGKLIDVNRSYGSEVYDLAKQVPDLLLLVGDKRHSKLFEELRQGSSPAVAHGGYGIRIDSPFEDTYRAQWHQEYPAQLRSPNGIVFWTPLVPVTAEIGPVQIALGSHREGPLPVVKESDGQRSGAYALKLASETEVLSRYETVSPIMEPGDLLLMDFMLLHSSGFNRGLRSRWSIQFRYFDLQHPVGRANGWVGSFAEGVDFSKVHPELLVEEPNDGK